MSDTELEPLDPTKPIAYMDDGPARLLIWNLMQHVIALQKRVAELEAKCSEF
jgi:hypothetical protein